MQREMRQSCRYFLYRIDLHEDKPRRSQWILVLEMMSHKWGWPKSWHLQIVIIIGFFPLDMKKASLSPLSRLLFFFSPKSGHALTPEISKDTAVATGMLRYVIHPNMSHTPGQIFYCRLRHMKVQVLILLKTINHSHKWQQICTLKLRH